jgi:hypothetical protein
MVTYCQNFLCYTTQKATVSGEREGVLTNVGSGEREGVLMLPPCYATVTWFGYIFLYYYYILILYSNNVTVI